MRCSYKTCFRDFPGGSVAKPRAMQATWVWSLGWEDLLEKGMATHSSILTWRIPMDRGAWWAAVNRVTKSQIWLSDEAQHTARSRTRQGRPFLAILFNIVSKVLAIAITEEKQNLKKKMLKLSLFADDMLQYKGNTEDATRKHLELISEFCKVAGCKINTQKYLALL